MIFKKFRLDYKQYNSLLKAENERLIKRIAQIESERDRAVSDKENAIRLLNTYKGEYESLVEDSKKLVEKQKNSEKAVDAIINAMKKEFEHLQENA